MKKRSFISGAAAIFAALLFAGAALAAGKQPAAASATQQKGQPAAGQQGRPADFSYPRIVHPTRVGKPLDIPDIGGYRVLKCDFHNHTLLSADGLVSPMNRITEGIETGLDALAITDHFGYVRSAAIPEATEAKFFERARAIAAANHFTFIMGSELNATTKAWPIIHANALFLKDKNDIRDMYDLIAKDQSNVDTPQKAYDVFVEQIRMAKAKGAFTELNHPWFMQPGDKFAITPTLKRLFDEKLFDGIEIVNASIREQVDNDAFALCLEKGLTIIGNTDCHDLIFTYLNNFHIAHRGMTLVFARENSAAAIREALDAGRTIAVSNFKFYGRPDNIEMLVRGTIVAQVDPAANLLSLRNLSGLPYRLDVVLPDGYVKPEWVQLDAHGVVSVRLERLDNAAGAFAGSVTLVVRNAFVAPDKNFSMTVN